MVGVDLDMAPIDGIIGEMKLYETGFGRLMSYTGTLASHPNKSRIGKIAVELKGEGGSSGVYGQRRRLDHHKRGL